jgi:CHASE3 domain sensor protein
MGESAGLRRGTQVLALLACVVVLAALGLAVFSALRSNSAAVQRSTSLDPATSGTAALLADVVDQESALRAYLLTARVDPHLDDYETAKSRVPPRFASLEELLADFDIPSVDLQRVKTAYDEWLDDVAEPQVDAMSEGNPAAAIREEASGESRRLFEAIRDRFADLAEAITAEQTQAFEQVETSTRILLSSLAAAVLVIVGVVAAMVVALRQWLLAPIEALRRAVNAVAAGRYDTQIPAVGPPEIVQLAGNLEAMRAELVRLVRQNERSWEALAQQGPAVVALRDALTPSRLHAPGLVLRGRVDPADGELAGDWYDSFDLPDGRIGVVVGDVSGHGAEAGVFALRLKQLLGAALVTGASPGEAIEWAVESLGETDEMFATAVVAVVDPDVGQLNYANAGHPDALLLRRSLGLATTHVGSGNGERLNGNGTGTRSTPPARIDPLGATGPLVSSLLASPDAWRTEVVRLVPGDVLFVYTDGLVEARDGDGVQFGQQRLAAECLRDPTRLPGELLDDVFDAVRRHAPGRATDDRTAIVLARTETFVSLRRTSAGGVPGTP